MRVEKAAAHLVAVRGVRLRAEERKAAVAGDLRRDALHDERAEELFRVVPDAEEIVVGMRVDKARADHFPGKVDRYVRRLFDLAAGRKDPVAFDEDVSFMRRAAGAVHDRSVLE